MPLLLAETVRITETLRETGQFFPGSQAGTWQRVLREARVYCQTKQRVRGCACPRERPALLDTSSHRGPDVTGA